MDNSFGHHGLDDDAFGEKNISSTVKAFDAFPKTKPSYTQQTNSGGVFTVVLLCASLWLASTELGRWWAGETTHGFSVEQGVGHDLQINMDIVVAMKCEDLHVNVQDAAGDRILASSALYKDPTTWWIWENKLGHQLGFTKEDRTSNEFAEQDVHDYIGHSANTRKKKFKGTPRIRRGHVANACRIYGSLHGNKVQGDFHITARGHGYMEAGQHLDHTSFNFSHHVNELSFGPFYPDLVNPLDNTLATAETHFHKFQYYLSLVPTIYTTDTGSIRSIDKYHESPASGEDGLKSNPYRFSSNTVFTNQYAVTEQSHKVSETAVPGIFVKFDVEPIMLTIAEEWSSIPALLVRIVNVISGVLVAGGWIFQLSEWFRETYGKRSRASGFGVLHGGMSEKHV
ncbi:hypothetical protein R9X50_00532700 [Acrodontium crateriforme]|uniref:Endoplasmic reticulum-Golgi intermediate compartment protein n=1 Tax=Acrodontium crateriforme TaxID=150365 RepID=A0AAQ3M7B8_9PEZI|nr:hypothetical protein R9X50_00532700 [Acrodontium crateriforme]